jgi:hypothetical protein
VEGIFTEPSPDGYAVRVDLKKTNPAALGKDGGVGDYQTGCGGLIPPSTNRSLDSTFFLPKLHAPRFEPTR